MNTYFEVEEKGTGLIILTSHEREQLKIPSGHPSIPSLKWQRYNLYTMLSPSDSELLDGLRGAPIVSVDSGDLACVVDIAAGDDAQRAALDGLIAQG